MVSPPSEPSVAPSSADVAAPRFLVFDWDGTAVTSRADDAAGHLIEPLERLIEHGVLPYVVTGTRHDWAARQLANLDPDLLGQIVVCCNRGSEVYRLGPDGPTRLHLVEMTPEAAQALDDVTQALIGPLREAGLDVQLVTDRLNRIKVDLLPDWTDPPKQDIDAVMDLANERYREFGGLAGLLARTAELTAAVGPKLRVTSDAKHIEIGITDKADSMDWVLQDIAGHGGTVQELAVIGDEFGPIGEAEGSDSKTAVAGATVYSVGREPNGVPEGIHHVGGGPERFVAILRDLASRQPN